MNEADPLASLRDIHAPPPPDGLSAWPIFAAVAALVAIVLLGVWLVARSRQRWAVELTGMLENLPAISPDSSLTEAARLLRRVATLKLGHTAAKLQGADWLAALDALLRTRFFSAGEGRVFGEAMYRPSLRNIDAGPVLEELRRLARRRAWLPW